MYDLNHPLTFLERDPKSGKLKMKRHDRRPKAIKQAEAKLKASPPAAKSDPKLRHEGGHILILGAGVAGMTAAYDLLKMNLEPSQKKPITVTILEATGRVGGRSLTLRPGNPNNPTPADSFTEEVPVNGGTQEVTQTCTFETDSDDPYPPYLNAGPGRIPSFHTDLLRLCKELKVDLEVYIMESRSNLVWTKDGLKNHSGVNRQVANDIRGYVAEELHDLLTKEEGKSGFKNQDTKDNFLKLLRYFGALETVSEDDDEAVEAVYVGSQRSGYTEFPGLYNAGKIRRPLKKDDLANAKLWERSFYQAEDFEWQTTSFQPVGGMDKIHEALHREVVRIHQQCGFPGNPVHLSCPVKSIHRQGDQWEVEYEEGGEIKSIQGDYCLSNIPMVLTQSLLQEDDFSNTYWSDFSQVTGTDDIMGPTCKVGWQAERKLWQEDTYTNLVPIFGGISRIEHPMTQMWYPSDHYHGNLGVLTGAYNYSKEAKRWGNMLPSERVDEARDGAALLHSKKFAGGLEQGISIAWQNIPTQKGGWTNWENIQPYKDENGKVRTPVEILNNLRRGDNNFHIIGDQISFLPGWQEGAVQSALEVFAKVTELDRYNLPVAASVPNSKELIFGHMY